MSLAKEALPVMEKMAAKDDTVDLLEIIETNTRDALGKAIYPLDVKSLRVLLP